MSNDTEVLRQCLEAVAETDVDISPEVYAAFSASWPESDKHLAILDERMKGRMLDQVYQLLVGETDNEYVQFEARTHREYGASPTLYRGLLTAVKNTVRDNMGKDWAATQETAWNRSIESIVDEFSQVN